jgi:hypothetical protein
MDDVLRHLWRNAASHGAPAGDEDPQNQKRQKRNHDEIRMSEASFDSRFCRQEVPKFRFRSVLEFVKVHFAPFPLRRPARNVSSGGAGNVTSAPEAVAFARAGEILAEMNNHLGQLHNGRALRLHN